MKKIDRQKISRPELRITEEALRQIDLRLQYEPNMENKVFRIHADGKGCDGFTYGAYFTLKDEEDFSYGFTAPLSGKDIEVVIEPFTAFYASSLNLDYIFDPESDEEGFAIEIKNNQDFSGKFFKEEDAHLPPTID